MASPDWKRWARTAVRDPESPSGLTKDALAALTGQDSRVLDTIAACWVLYACSDSDGRVAALSAIRRLLPAMQPSTRWVARELIPFALDWADRDRLWALVNVQ